MKRLALALVGAAALALALAPVAMGVPTFVPSGASAAILNVAAVDPNPMPLDTRCTAEDMTSIVGNAHVMAQGAGPSTIVVVEGVTATPPPLTFRR